LKKNLIDFFGLKNKGFAKGFRPILFMICRSSKTDSLNSNPRFNLNEIKPALHSLIEAIVSFQKF
jgi:hypothetical protein